MDRILNDICSLVLKISNCPLEIIEKNTLKSLLGEPFYMQSEELLYLYFHLKNKYHIEFKDKDILNYQFTSIYNISNIINRYSKVN